MLADEIVNALTTEGEILWALADQVGTIRDIGTWNDPSSEYEIANHRVYDSFGNLTDETNSSVDLAFGFTGRWTDAATGMTNHLNRWFDSSIGKWLSNDPIGFGGGDANVQRYVVNNPLQFVDNNGLDKSPPGGGGGGGDDVMGVSGIDQGADQGGVPAGSTRLDEDNTVASVSINLGGVGMIRGSGPQPSFDVDYGGSVFSAFLWVLGAPGNTILEGDLDKDFQGTVQTYAFGGAAIAGGVAVGIVAAPLVAPYVYIYGTGAAGWAGGADRARSYRGHR